MNMTKKPTKTYTKINTLYCRYQFPSGVEIPNQKWKKFKNKIILGKFADETFEFLQNNKFESYSKIDGTNSKIVYYPSTETIQVGGKSDNAESQHGQFEYLQEVADRILPEMKKLFPKENARFSPNVDENGKVIVAEYNGVHAVEMVEDPVYIYGEYYGEGIQKGGNYCKGNRFAVFDICDKGWWIPSNLRSAYCKTLNLEEVPFVGVMTIKEAEEMVREGFATKVDNVSNPDYVEEGLVLRPVVAIKSPRSKRVIVKIKHKDYHEFDVVRKEFTDEEFAEFQKWYDEVTSEDYLEYYREKNRRIG